VLYCINSVSFVLAKLTSFYNNKTWIHKKVSDVECLVYPTKMFRESFQNFLPTNNNYVSVQLCMSFN